MASNKYDQQEHTYIPTKHPQHKMEYINQLYHKYNVYLSANRHFFTKILQVNINNKSRRKSLIQRWLLMNMINKNIHTYLLNIPNMKWDTLTSYSVYHKYISQQKTWTKLFTDGRTDGQTDRQTDNPKTVWLRMPSARGHKNACKSASGGHFGFSNFHQNLINKEQYIDEYSLKIWLIKAVDWSKLSDQSVFE